MEATLNITEITWKLSTVKNRTVNVNLEENSFMWIRFYDKHKRYREDITIGIKAGWPVVQKRIKAVSHEITKFFKLKIDQRDVTRELKKLIS